MESIGLQRLLDQIQSGDEDASEAIYREYVPYLRMVVRRQISPSLRAKFDSLDVVQSVWVDLLDGLRCGRWSFQSPGHLRAFLIRATRNRLVDYTRRHRQAIESDSNCTQSKLTCRLPRPSVQVSANEELEKLLADCPAEHRPIIELKHQGYSLAEISERTGYHPSSIRRILYGIAKKQR